MVSEDAVIIRLLKFLLSHPWCDPLLRRISPVAGFRILTFHRVLPDETQPGDYRLLLGNPTAAQFESLIVELTRRFHIRPLSELVDRAPSWDGEFALGISFDDGYADVARIAAPILLRHGVPFTVFLTTAFLDGEIPWFSRLFAFAHSADLRADSLWLPEGVRWDENSPSSLRTSLARYLNRMDTKRIHEMLDELETRNPWYRPPTDLRNLEAFMTWDDVRRLQCSPLVTWGSHTVTHPNVTALEPLRLEEELRLSRHRIEHETGRECDLIAYPGGYYESRIAGAVRDAGYRAGFVMREGINRRVLDPYAIRRHYVPTDLPGALLKVYGLSRQRPR